MTGKKHYDRIDLSFFGH